ncbi:MAG: glycosyl hydrolase family 32 [Clostridia bacterium]|nr:glycosyl hydrolase family 32 [Clostridia bacterium]
MEKLYNNIILADDFQSKPSRPDDVPYLKNPPEVINVTVGRQLFVDDFLIEETTLTPTYHMAKKFDGNPVLKPEMPWEKETGSASTTPKGGGVWYDEEEKIFKMWYEACWLNQMCYATSKDGIHWERPDLGLEPGTNKIMLWKGKAPENPERWLRPDSTAVFIDYDAPKEQRYKLALHGPSSHSPGVAATSADGIHWENITKTGLADDRTTMFYNPFRKKWVYSIRSAWHDRSRDYIECDDLLAGAKWELSDRHNWLACDEFDRPDPYFCHSNVADKSDSVYTPGLYNIDCVGYESIMLGMFELHQGLSNKTFGDAGVPKITDLMPIYSRDGYHFSRPCRDPFIPSSRYRGAWDRGYVQSVGGVCIIHGDELWIYYTGFAGDERYGRAWSDDDNKTGMYMNGATGIAKLRRDGFVSMDGSGSILTRKLEFSGKRSLHVNAAGSVKAAILSADGRILAESAPFAGDSTNAKLDFGGFDVASLNGQVIRLRFDVSGSIYAFGFADEKGDFGGAHAAGVVKL